MNSSPSRASTFSMGIAPVGLVITGGAVVWTMFAGVPLFLPALLFNCTLGAISFLVKYQSLKRNKDPWMSFVLSAMNNFGTIVGCYVSFHIFYDTPEKIAAAVQIVAMVMFVFLSLLIGLKEYLRGTSDGPL